MTSPPEKTRLDRDVIALLWSKVVERLDKGEVLITNLHYQEAMEEDFGHINGGAPTEAKKLSINRMIAEVNRKYPETYVAKGVINAVGRAFEEGVQQLNWSVAQIQERGARSIRRFTQLDEVLDLLDEANIRPDQVDLLGCVKNVLREMESKLPKPAATVSVKEVNRKRKTKTRPRSVEREADAGSRSLVTGSELMEAVQNGEVNRDELIERSLQQKKRSAEIEAAEMAAAPERVQAYVERGLITEDEGNKVRRLNTLYEKRRRGQIDDRDFSRVRNSILSGQARDELDRRVREVVSGHLRYLEVFDSMKRIDERFDDALRFLIYYKECVVAEKDSQVDLTPVIETLTGNTELLQSLIAIMDRTDAEIRMMSVRLPPYNQAMKRGMEKIANLTIQGTFVDDLRNLELGSMSELLNSTDKEIRARSAADLRCLVSLIDHLTKKTRFRKEIRMLKIGLTLREFFQSIADPEKARQQAESYLNMRVRRLYPDMVGSELSEIQQRGAEMLDTIEQEVREEQSSAPQSSYFADSQPSGSTEKGEGRDLDLTEDEERSGVQIGRVEIRVAGTSRRVPYKIMIDPDEPGTYVIARRDPATGELVPQRRRGSKRVVERDREGVWHVT